MSTGWSPATCRRRSTLIGTSTRPSSIVGGAAPRSSAKRLAGALAIAGICAGLGFGLETTRAAGYAGSTVCKSCHAVEAAAWERSDHFRAMQDATPANVAGDFSDVRVTFHDMDTRFIRDGDDHFVETVGPAGDRGKFAVRYTFGHRPLQQYLLDRGDGVLQAFDVAWDTRPAPDGQRWFHLQPDEPMAPEHPFFWTRHAMDWSSHCADCHSTNVVKNLNATTGRFRTDYAEANVACEACHGPGGEHVRLAQAGTLAESSHSGFGVGLGKRVQWRFAPGNPIAEPHGNPADRDIDMCGGCHSLRTPLVTDAIGRP
ncbi:MAG: hypothetical protein J4F38_05335 [Pseudomonadales bacterium]|nr:hypothetical protein [Pseudomonadales bacterium]